METLERYAAFISYRHLPEDRRWASWLIDQLERFRTPGSLVRQGFRRQLGRVFRDEDEIPASSNLSIEIEEALSRSDALIVVASSATPESKWIDREVRFFKDRGLSDRIFVLLIEGDPEDAFPSLLLEGGQEPIAADVRPRPDASPAKLRAMARHRLIAALLGCTYDDLRRRDSQRRRRTFLLAASAALLLLSVIAGVTVQSMRRQLTLDMTAAMSVMPPSRERRATPAQYAFSLLPRDNPLRAETPAIIRDALRPVARQAALLRVTSHSARSSTYYGPTRFASRDGTSQWVGFYNGSVAVVTVHGELRLFAEGGCPSENASFIYRCAVTALATLEGDDFVAGDFSGFLRIVRGGRTNWIQVSDSRIAYVLGDSDGSFVVADAGGSLFRIGTDGAVQQLRTGGGAVAAMTHRDDHIEIVRRRGVIQRLRGSRLSTEATRDEIFLGSAMSGPRRVFLHSLIIDDYDELQRRDRIEIRAEGSDLFVALTTENFGSGSVGGMEIVDSEPGRPMIAGLALDLHRIDLDRGRVEDLQIGEPQNLDDRYTSEGTQLPRYFDATLGSAGGGRYIFTIYRGAVAVLDLEMLDRIDAIIDHSPNVRRDLCALGLGPAFSIAPSRDVCAGG